MSIVPPETFGLNYEIELTDQEQKLLNLDDANNAVVALIVYKQQSSEDTNMKVVIKAPIIINFKDKIGLQKSLDSIEITDLAA